MTIVDEATKLRDDILREFPSEDADPWHVALLHAKEYFTKKDADVMSDENLRKSIENIMTKGFSMYDAAVLLKRPLFDIVSTVLCSDDIRTHYYMCRLIQYWTAGHSASRIAYEFDSTVEDIRNDLVYVGYILPVGMSDYSLDTLNMALDVYMENACIMITGVLEAYANAFTNHGNLEVRRYRNDRM